MASARILLFFQLVTVFSLHMFILRKSTFILIFKTQEQGYLTIIAFNILSCTICILFAVFYPSIGNVIRLSGAFCGAVLIFILPSLLYLADANQENRLNVLNTSIHVSIMLLGIAMAFAQFTVWFRRTKKLHGPQLVAPVTHYLSHCPISPLYLT